MTIEVRHTGLEGVLEIIPQQYHDTRGFFSETYNRDSFRQAGIDLTFIQDNFSYSVKKGVLRGLHYQLPPMAQDKLVRVSSGSILDVVVDIRRASETFGRWTSLIVSAKKWNQILVPRGFAHGFLTLEDETEVSYKVSEVFSQEHDRCIRFDDSEIDIDWSVPCEDLIVSEKDLAAPYLRDAELFESPELAEQ